MNQEFRNIINKLTEEIISEYKIRIPITDIYDTVNRLGGSIEEKYELGTMVDGSIQKKDEGFVITVSPFISEGRKNFTVAHELGHLFLHMGYMTNEELWNEQEDEVYYRSGESALEYQANEFAAALLMPRKEYEEQLDKNTRDDNIVNTAQIAEYFNVSVSAASNRGKFLGYLKW